MANPDQLSKLTVEGVPAWNKLQKALPRPMVADLQGADLSGKDLSGADLRGARLEGAKLRGTKFGPGTLLWDAKITKADAYQADFSGAWLDNADFTGTDLFETKFRDANLRGADLSNTDGFLRTEQFAGADLTGAKLPERLKRLYESLENVKGISESARKVFLALLAACLYCWLTIATTTDVNLLTNRASSPLPIIQTAIPIVGFYVVAPLLVLCVYFYFHFYLQKLWEELGSLPAIFPDGRPLHSQVDPWLLNDLVRAHLPKLNVDRPFLSYLQLWISVLLAWWVVPITMLLFWGRYLRRHESVGTAFHVALLVSSLVGAVCLYRLAVATLRGRKREPFTWRGVLYKRRGYWTAAFGVAAAVLFGLISLGAIKGERSGKPILGISMPESESFSGKEADGPRTWVPRWMALIGNPPFANLADADVSLKKPTWNRKNDPDSIVGAQLSRANLRYASGRRAFLAGSKMWKTNLRGAYLGDSDLSDSFLEEVNLNDAKLIGARLSNSDLSGANLVSADLTGADLSGTNLAFADLTGVSLYFADLTYCDFRLVKNLDPKAVRESGRPGLEVWKKAFYDNAMLNELGLPPDHNDTLEEQRKREAELQQRESSAQPGLNPLPPQR